MTLRPMFCGLTIRRLGVAAILVAAATASAHAQFGGIFGEPPRPPSNIPRGNDTFIDRQGSGESQPPRPQRRQSAPQPLPPPVDDPELVGIPPPPAAAPTRGAAPPSGGFQGQALAPPPGVPAEASAPAAPRPTLPDQTGATPAPPGSGGQEAIIPPSPNKVVNPTAVFAGLDKVTGRITSFDVQMGETVQFGALRVTPRACYTRPPTETASTDSFVEVEEVTLKAEVKRVFTGWMFAASPGLHGVEHPIYDVWLTDCKGGAQTVAEAPPPPQPPAPARTPATTPPSSRQPAPARAPAAAPAARQPAAAPGGMLPPPR